MKITRVKINAYFKGLVLLMKPHIFFGWLRHPFQTASNTISLSKWISKQEKKDVYNDFYTSKRDSNRRYKMYEYIVDKVALKNEAIDYLEFGVFAGHSFKWWLANTTNPESRYYGFDTFEGLPEDWGRFNKGDMFANIPETDDTRAKFVKGLFQDSVPEFLNTHNLKNGKRKIIHMDADLFSSTVFALTSMAPYLKKGDILMFDEFNVPNHEFFAFKIFCEAYYVKTRMLVAVNNYYQVGLIIE